jgi:hypothetical protein
MHRAALNGLKMVGNKLSAKEEEAYRNKGTHKPRSPRRHNSPRHRSGSRRSRTPSPGRYNSPKNKGTRRSRTPNKTHDYEDDEKEMGAPCFILGSLTSGPGTCHISKYGALHVSVTSDETLIRI